MLLTTESFVIIPFRHEQLLEVSQAVELACRQRVVVQPVIREYESTCEMR